MGIVVIEEGRPDGGDLVVRMSDPGRMNGVTKAAEQQKVIKVLDLGDGFAFADVGIRAVWADETKETLAFVLVALAGKNSQLMGLQAIPTVVAELGRIKVEDLKAGIAKALNPPEAA